MKRFSVPIYFALALFSCPAIAQQNTGSVKGKVSTSDGERAAYVSVGLTGTAAGTLTNEKGEYTLNRVKAGTYTITVSAVGLETQSKQIAVIAGKSVQVSFTLNENAQRLKEVVISAAPHKYKIDQPSNSLRLDEPLLEVAQNIQVVTSGTLADQQVISMSDNLIRNVSGAVKMEHWGDLYANISMRGSQIQAFRNGFNVVASYWGPLTEDMSFVDHIEFVKGPAGFMLSNGDPSGLYNVVTKKPTGQNKGEISTTLGSYGLFRTTLDLDGKLDKNGKLLYRFNIAGQNKNSHRPYEYNDRLSIAPVISYQVDDKTKITAEYTYQGAKMSDVGSYYVFGTDGYATLPVDFTLLAPGLQPTRISDHSAYVTLQHQLSTNWKLTAQASYFNYKQNGSSMWPNMVNADGTIERSTGIWDAQSQMRMGQIFLNGTVTTGAVKHRILGGIDVGRKNYEADWAQSHALDAPGALFDVNNPNYGVPSNGYPAYNRTLNLEARAVQAGGLMDQQYTGLYLQDELGFFDNKLRLTIAGRYTEVSQSTWGGAPIAGRKFTPRFGLSATITPQTSVYAVFDQAFIPQTGTLRGGGPVKHLTGNNMEVGIKKDWFNGSWNTTLSAYRILKNNEITGDPLDPNSKLSIVIGQKRAQGVEFDVRGDIIKGLSVTANYAYTNAVVTKAFDGSGLVEGQLVPGYAKHTVNGWLTYRLGQGALKGAGLSGGFTYLNDRATDAWGVAPIGLPDYFRLDGGLSWQKDGITINANIFNVLDKYLFSGSYETYANSYYWQTEAPRNYRVSVGYKF